MTQVQNMGPGASPRPKSTFSEPGVKGSTLLLNLNSGLKPSINNDSRRTNKLDFANGIEVTADSKW